MIVKAMVNHGGAMEVQEAGCRAVCNLADNAGNRAEIARLGGIVAVVKAMMNYGRSPEVQEQGCRALSGLASAADMLEQIVKQGGIDAIVKAMANHGSVAAVQLQGCRALGDLALDNADNQVEIARQGGIDAIVKALANHGSVAEVQERGCLVLLRSDWSQEDVRARIMEVGVKEVVQQAARRAMSATNATANAKQYAQQLLARLECEAAFLYFQQKS